MSGANEGSSGINPMLSTARGRLSTLARTTETPQQLRQQEAPFLHDAHNCDYLATVVC